MPNLALLRCGARPNTSSPQRLYVTSLPPIGFTPDWNSGKSSTLWARIQRPDRDHQDALISQWWPHFVLHAPRLRRLSSNTQEPYRTLTSGNRCLHPMVEREARSTCCRTASSLVFESKSGENSTTIPSTMASTGSITSSSLSRFVVQSHFCQTRLSDGHPVQP